MTVDFPIRFSPLPRSLVTATGPDDAPFRLEMRLLELSCLRETSHQSGEEALCQRWLHREERGKLASLRHWKRRVEWLGGRLCVKEALLACLRSARPAAADIPASHLRIGALPSGRPFLNPDPLTGELAAPCISISHSGEYAMAVAAAVPCGIDIQENREALGRVRERFCEPREEELMRHHLAAMAPSERLTLLWAAKESVKKGVVTGRMPGFLELTLRHVDPVSAPDHQGCFRLTFACRADHRATTGAPPSGAPPVLQALVCLHRGYGIGLHLAPPPDFSRSRHA